MQNKINVYDFLWKSTKGRRFLLSVLVIFYTIDDIISIFVAQYFNKKMVNYLGMENSTLLSGVTFILLYVLCGNITWIMAIIISKLKLSSIFVVQYKIRNNLFDYITKHSMDYFNNSFSGALNSKITSSVLHSGMLIYHICKIIENCIIILLTPILYAQINIYIGICFGLIAVFYVYITKNIKNDVMKKSDYLAEEKSKYFALINDDLTNIVNIKTFSRVFKERINIKKQNINILRKEFDYKKTNRKFFIIRFIIAFLLFTSVLGIGSFLLYHRKINMGDFLYLTTVTTILNFMVKQLGDKISSIALEKGILENNLSKIFQPIEIQNKSVSNRLIVSNGKIVFKNIFFSYGVKQNEN